MRLQNSTVYKPFWIAFLTLLGLGALGVWAGIPERGMPVFLAGLGLLLAVTLAYGLLAWRLLMRPLPAGFHTTAARRLPPDIRKLYAVLLTAAGLCLLVGGFWDEVWHRAYGLPFGEDLLWRPHLLIYAGLLTTPALAGISLVYRMRNGAGGILQQLRDDRRLGLLVVVGGFLLYVVPADPLWHIFFGEDISAWSLPHLLLLVSVIGIMLLAALMHLTSLAPRQRGTAFRLRFAEGMVIAAFAIMLNLMLQVLATDWENGNPQLAQRPEWLLPAIFAALSGFVGGLTNRSLRSAGGASLVGGLALLFRWGLIQLFAYHQIHVVTWLPVLPSLIVLDLGYALSLRLNSRAPSALGSAFLVMAGLMAGGIPLINRYYEAVQVGGSELALVALAVMGTAWGGAWIGQELGDTLFRERSRAEAKAVIESTAGEGLGDITPLRRWTPLLVLISTAAFILFFIFTAKPPV